ncbi:hypothetical protein ACQP0C_31470 [Nocardia sp. CA-129566]|uniref:hypothetical protein n=1 Tax=Nocardia sp. CA-129566 TaxID=3239976 RepID=UPI003D96982D
MRGNSHVRFGGRSWETDPRQPGHRAQGRPYIRSRAQRLGYDLAKIVTFSARTVDPEGRLVNVVQALDVDTVIAPSLEHFDGRVPERLVRGCELNTVNPEATYAPHAPFQFVDADGDGA